MKIASGQKNLNEQGAAGLAEAPSRSRGEPRTWLGKVEKRWKDLKKCWRDGADEAVKIYEAYDPEKYSFNILYSNTEVILPALYNSTPRPEVSARYSSLQTQERILDRAVANTIERSCEYFADADQGEYETYDAVLKDAVTGMLVPGLGQARVRHHGEAGYQTICFESVSYDRFVWAYARKWCQVPWIGFGHDLEQTDFEEQFPAFASTQAYKDFEWASLEQEDSSRGSDDAPQAKGTALLVWEVWDWASKSVFFICEHWPDQYLDEQSYPKHLTSRFPCPEPLIFAGKLKKIEPIVPYRLYKAQAEELNQISRRIARVTRAIRARGIYNAVFGEIEQLLNEDDDNILVPAEGAAAFQESGLERQVWFMPIDVLVATLMQLYQARAEAKQAIYEIMGIGDILRGTSNPNETARAQEIKNQWGSLRIKKAQKDVQTFCLELFRIAMELAVEYLSPASWKSITRLPYLFQGQKMQIQQQMQMLQRQMQAAQAAAQQGDPQAQQAVQQMQQAVPPEMGQLLQLPTWEEVLAVLQGRFERTYRIDIETNSTVDLEATEDKTAIGEFMNAFGQMTAGLAPMVESGALPGEAAKEIMSETFRRFRFGRKVSEALEQLQAPQQGDPEGDLNRAKEQGQLEIKKVQADTAAKLAGAEQQMTQVMGENERLKTENAALKQASRMQQQEQQLGERQLSLDFKERSQQQKADYDGKVRLAQQDGAQKSQELRVQELNALAQKIQATIQVFEQKAAAEKQQAASDAQEASSQRQEQQQGLLVEALGEMKEALASVAQLAGAERESEIIVGPDGKKRARSRPVLND